MGGHRRDIAGGEDPRVGRRAQGLVDRDKAALGQGQPGVGEPRGGAGLGHPQGFVERDAPAAGADERSRLDTNDRAVGLHGNAVLGENPLEKVAHPTIVRGQQRIAGDERHFRRQAQRSEAMLRGQSELDTAGATADHREPQPRHCPGAGQQVSPPRREIGDRLDRDRVLDGARDIMRARRRADVERNEIVADRRVAAAQHMALAAVEADRLVADRRAPAKRVRRPRSMWHSSNR